MLLTRTKWTWRLEVRVGGNTIHCADFLLILISRCLCDLNLWTVALGSSVQIALFVLPLVVVIGWFTGKEMTLKFPSFEVYLYLISVVIVSLCLGNQRSNWLEGSLLVSTYIIIAVGIYYEKDIVDGLN